MAKIDFTVEKKKINKHNTRSLTVLLFLITGVYGGILYLWLIPGITFSGRIVCLLSAALCIVLWYSYFYGKRLFAFLVVIVSVISCVSGFMMKNRLMIQLKQIAEGISGKTNQEAVLVTETALLLAVGISITLFVLEIILQSHAVLYLLVSGLLLLGPLLGIRPGIGAVLLAAFFQITFWALHLPGKRSGSRTLREKSMRLTAAVLAVSLLAAFLFVSHYAEELYNFVFTAEGYVVRTISQLSGSAGEPVTGGRIHGGNNYRTGTGHLELTASRQPTEVLYLRGFCGGEYIGGDWIQSSDEQFFTAMAEKLGWQGWEYGISMMYYSMYFVMNSILQNNEEQAPYSLTVRHFNGEYGNAYVPYYSQRERGRNGFEGDRTDREGYIFQYFEPSDMDIKWDNVPENFEQARDWYMVLRDVYMEEIQTAYTQVPTELLPQMINLVEENPMDGLDEITAFILYTLHSNISYTLTPGWAPLNEDIAEYFLFESGQGYCEHFALAATLLYRLYGIPARYVTGYMVSPSDFELQEDGTCRVVVTDENAHAWTEIFLADYGWTPVEVTPASDGSVAAGYPGVDGLEFDRMLSERNWNLDVPRLPQSGISSGNTPDTVQDMAFEWKIDFGKYFEEYEKLLWILGTILFYSVFLTPFFLEYRRLRRLKKMESMSCRKIFTKFMEMLHFAGYFQGYDGSEKEFVSEFAAEIPVVSSEEIMQLQTIVCEAAYSSGNPTIEKEEMVRNIYFRTGRFLYGKLKWNRKLLFRYWNIFG